MLIDVHFHLDLMDNMQSLIHEFQTSDVGIIAVGTTPKAFGKEKKFCCGVKNIKVGLGFHPQLVFERAHEIDLFLKFVKDSQYIGEVGIDFNSSYIGSKAQQISCFRKIAKACADEGGKILSIHSVKAASTIIDELEEAGTFQTCKCIFHWFTGTSTERNRAVENGAFFSINRKMLVTKSGRELVKVIPEDRLLLETDAPFTMKFNSIVGLRAELLKLVDDISAIRAKDLSVQIEKNSLQIWEQLE
jgi:TatD DNase family protein